MNEGLCYFFESGSLDRVSICENNEEVSFLYRFKNGKMIEYNGGVKRFEGYYEGSIEKGFSRTYGKEYDDEGKKVIYEGEFVDGQRYGLGVLYNDNNEIIYNGVVNVVNCFQNCIFVLPNTAHSPLLLLRRLL